MDLSKSSDDSVINFIKRIIEHQYEKYKLVFRDGQYSSSRMFDIIKNIEIKLKMNASKMQAVNIYFKLSAKEKDILEIDLNNVTGLDITTFKSMAEKSKYKDEITIVNGQ